MKGLASYVMGAAALALLGGALMGAGMLDRRLADAQQSLVALNEDDAAARLQMSERYFEYASHVPGVGTGSLNDLRARIAEWRYWRRQYRTLVPQRSDPFGGIASDNVALQLIVANAVYRAGQAEAVNRETVLDALDRGIDAYQTVLKNATREESAAYNYEYLVRLREDIRKGRRKPDLSSTGLEAPFGRTGGQPAERKTGDFKILVPLESQEREQGGQAGKAGPMKRKG